MGKKYDERYTNPIVKYPEWIMIWGAMSVCATSVFITFLLKPLWMKIVTLILYMLHLKLHIRIQQIFILMHNGASFHKSNEVNDWQRSKIRCLIDHVTAKILTQYTISGVIWKKENAANSNHQALRNIFQS